MSRAYYNENDPFAANWLRNLIAAGLITDGDVDTRSIVDVRPTDLDGYERCHFFAGIGGWDYALQLAGWTGPVWTGSCPCQPFSSAGKGRGTDDERHLWPEFARLIRECGPATVFGEQVASKAGREWLSGVFTDLEGMGYAAAGADLCAAGVNAPHIRQRLFWVADSQNSGRRSARVGCNQDEAHRTYAARGQDSSGVPRHAGHSGSNDHRLADAEHDGSYQPQRTATEPVGDGQDERVLERGGGLGNALKPRLQGYGRPVTVDAPEGWQAEERHSATASQWSDFDLVRCVEPTKEPGRYVEKWRRVESGLVPLAARVSGRVGRLRGYGNAIVPQLAAEFIQAFKDTE